MPKHVLRAGKSMIAAISSLGEALGYVVEQEYPVEADRVNPPAIDVAWFSEDDQRFPLMIFEVESRATSSIANNVTKVFGQSSERFEKPLFFFHVVLRASETSRLANLERLFGTYNYKCFNLSEATSGHLLEAALAQHRRVQHRLQLEPLFKCLDLEGWQGVPSVDLLTMVRRHRFEADFVPALARLARDDRRHLDALIEWLSSSDQGNGTRQVADAYYEAYLGWGWSEALHMGLLGAERHHLAGAMAQRYREWQLGVGGLARIAPHFGLSRDHDEFLVGGAPVLCAVMGALIPALVDALLETLADVRDALADWAGIPNAIWTLHIAAAFKRRDHFESARSHINRWGGINRTWALEPRGLFDLSGDHTWPEEIKEQAEAVPPLEEFQRNVAAVVGGIQNPSAVTVALRLLTDWTYGWDPMPDLVAALRSEGNGA